MNLCNYNFQNLLILKITNILFQFKTSPVVPCRPLAFTNLLISYYFLGAKQCGKNQTFGVLKSVRDGKVLDYIWSLWSSTILLSLQFWAFPIWNEKCWFEHTRTDCMQFECLTLVIRRYSVMVRSMKDIVDLTHLLRVMDSILGCHLSKWVKHELPRGNHCHAENDTLICIPFVSTLQATYSHLDSTDETLLSG